jgi:sialic acid synthase SpsE
LKSVTLNCIKEQPGASFLLEPDEFIQLCKDIKVAWSFLGVLKYERKKSKRKNITFRRQLYMVKDIKVKELLLEIIKRLPSLNIDWY